MGYVINVLFVGDGEAGHFARVAGEPAMGQRREVCVRPFGRRRRQEQLIHVTARGIEDMNLITGLFVAVRSYNDFFRATPLGIVL